MDAMSEPLDPTASARDLIAHARDTRVVVVGGGLSGLVSALECAKVGMSVTVLEQHGELGGGLRSVDLDGVGVDAFDDEVGSVTPEGHALLTEVGLADRVKPVEAVPRWIGGLGAGGGDAVAIPGDALVGIPANPWDAAVRRVIGWRGSWRAYVDRLRPPLTIGRERNLGALVRTRMGERVCDRLVAPVTRATLHLEPHETDVEAVAPGLNAALTSTGSLAGAVGALAGREPAGAMLVGGAFALVPALAALLHDYGVEIRTGTRAQTLERRGRGWAVSAVASGAAAEAGNAAEDDDAPFVADVAVLAVDEPMARRLLAGHADLPPADPPRTAEAVTLRVRMPAPARADVFPLHDEVWRVTDLTASRPWLSTAVPAGERIVRVLRVPADAAAASAGGARTDADVVDAARLAAAEAFGAEISPDDVVCAVRVRRQTSSRARIGHGDRVAAVRSALRDVPGVAVTGRWAAGDVIADVMTDAVAETLRVRRAVLWGGADDASS